MFALVWIISTAVNLYVFVIILQVALGWAIAFDLVNANNEAARNLTQLLHKLTDPVFKPIRKYVPPVGGIDLTPLIVIIGIQIIAGLVLALFVRTFSLPFMFF
ncbi:MAG: YggT family protein [Alphaproteobacteria bacterium]|nr:YggT family protein [Alphaproteobacteria bacterium]MBP7759338.1 YggT family protein [Alphaproteobacteria bacterium]MBP7762551.1 YggT family protein [Alphaproteobacteria bacterium]MBP7904298.1 YggT family protein [Alphaproteobacteria bacterium]